MRTVVREIFVWTWHENVRTKQKQQTKVNRAILGFSLAGKRRRMFWSFDLLADKTNNEHLPKPFFECECDVRCFFRHYGPQVMKLLRLVSLTLRMHQQACKDVLRWRQPYPTLDYFRKEFQSVWKIFQSWSFRLSNFFLC